MIPYSRQLPAKFVVSPFPPCSSYRWGMCIFRCTCFYSIIKVYFITIWLWTQRHYAMPGQQKREKHSAHKLSRCSAAGFSFPAVIVHPVVTSCELLLALSL